MTFAQDYDRMWPDTWSGRKKIYFFSWEGTSRKETAADWSNVTRATVSADPDGRPKACRSRSRSPDFAPAPAPGPYILVPEVQ